MPERPAHFLALAAPCPTCGSAPGQLCTSHSGTHTRRHDVHQTRTAAWRAAQTTQENPMTTPDRTTSVEETVASKVRLEDGSTHTMEAIADAGEACLQRVCMAAQQEDQLRHELYVLRAKVDGVLEQVADLVADGHISTSVVAGVRQDLRDALGLDTPTP